MILLASPRKYSPGLAAQYIYLAGALAVPDEPFPAANLPSQHLPCGGSKGLVC